jgi:5-dehydro-2-deoxygluconokinase
MPNTGEVLIRSLKRLYNLGIMPEWWKLPPPAKETWPALDALLRSVKRLYNLGIFPEWWKLPPPAAATWAALDALIAERDPYCRGVVLLGLSAPIDDLARGFAAARTARHCRGFAVGRTIFNDPARAWLSGDCSDDALVAGVRRRYEALIDAWMGAMAGAPARAPTAKESR